jgi:uncharacterized protein YukE
MVHEARHDFDLLDRRLAQHLDSVTCAWGGRGSTAFQSLGRAWSQRQRTIVGALDHLEESLRATEHDNVSTDESQSSAFTRVEHRLG